MLRPIRPTRSIRQTNQRRNLLSIAFVLALATTTALLTRLIELPTLAEALPQNRPITQAGVLKIQQVASAQNPLHISGAGFAPNERIQLFLQPQAETRFGQLAHMGSTQADAQGQLLAALSDSASAMLTEGSYIIARGERSGFTQPIGPLHASQPQIATATAIPPTPTTIPSPTPIPLDVNPLNRWYGEYFANRDLEDIPVLHRNDDALNFNWALGRINDALPADGVSARWVGRFNFDHTDNYQFTLLIDDGARVYYDEQLIMDQWHVGRRRTVTANVPVLKGEHRLRVEYYEDNGPAQIALSWKPNYAAWQGRYYNTPDLTGPVILRCDDGEVNGVLSKDWGNNGPGLGVNPDNFSVDWLSMVYFDKTGDYIFHLLADDGMRVFIDGVNVFDNWGGPVQTELTQRIARGRHRIQIQYVERTGAAAVHFDWAYVPPPAPEPTPIPVTS